MILSEMTPTDLLEYILEAHPEFKATSDASNKALWQLGLASASGVKEWFTQAEHAVHYARKDHLSINGHGTYPYEAMLRARLCGCQCEHSPQEYSELNFDLQLAAGEIGTPHLLTQRTYDWLAAATDGLPSWEGRLNADHMRGVLIDLDPHARVLREALNSTYSLLGGNESWYPQHTGIPHLRAEAKRTTAAWIERAVRVNAQLDHTLQTHQCECECVHGRAWA